MKDMHIFQELVVPFLIKLSTRQDEFDKFFENVFITAEMLEDLTFIPEFIECK